MVEFSSNLHQKVQNSCFFCTQSKTISASALLCILIDEYLLEKNENTLNFLLFEDEKSNTISPKNQQKSPKNDFFYKENYFSSEQS